MCITSIITTAVDTVFAVFFFVLTENNTDYASENKYLNF